MNFEEDEAALEAILFASGEPVGLDRICDALNMDRDTVDGLCRRLADEFRFRNRGLRVIRLDDSVQMCSAPEYADVVRAALVSRKPPKLSQPAMEVLAIVAYFQPVTRVYIEQVRGVDSSYTIGLLLERELIEEAGRLSVPGRPIQYRTTKNFLRVFGLEHLEELPELPGEDTEGTQLTIEMQMRIEKLKDEENQTAALQEPDVGIGQRKQPEESDPAKEEEETGP